MKRNASRGFFIGGTERRAPQLLLAEINRCLADSDLDEAIRRVDRLWRNNPDHANRIALPYARLLVRQGRDYGAALGLFRRVADLDDHASPDLEGELVAALLAGDQIFSATERLTAALQHFAVDPESPLASAADLLLQASQAPGWVGLRSDLSLVGQLLEPHRADELEVRDATGQIVPVERVDVTQGGAFCIEPASWLGMARGPLEITADGTPLFGSGLVLPPDLRIDGRTDRQGETVRGWYRLGWQPSLAGELWVRDERDSAARVPSRVDPGNPSRRQFRFVPEDLGLAGERLELTLRLPGWQPVALADSPFFCRLTAASRKLRKHLAAGRAEAAGVTVILPVYRGVEETQRCLDSVLATLPASAKLIVVDDASPEPALSTAVEQRCEGQPRVTWLRNPENLGFAGAVNRAFALEQTNDVILLNADTVVFPGWIERLQATAHSAADIGTVTPLSNDGSVVSYPRSAGLIRDLTEAADLDAHLAAHGDAAPIDLPVGVGFCLYIRRACLDEAGAFDEWVFPRGYGEETDFCLKASRRGWRHVLAPQVFVMHHKGRSFGGQRAALLARAGRLINLRYPGYDDLVQGFFEGDPLKPLFRRLDRYRLQRSGRVVLIVTLLMPGGVDRFVAERCRRLRRQGYVPVILRPEEGRKTRCAVLAEEPAIRHLRYHTPEEIPALLEMLESLAIDHVEIQHFLRLHPLLVAGVIGLGLPYDVYIHDYSWICHRVSMVGSEHRYCGEPPVEACTPCVKANGSRLFDRISPPNLRERSRHWLSSARRVVVPSQDAAHRFQRHFPQIDFHVEPLEGPPGTPQLVPSRPGRCRIALLGGLGTHKGYDVLLACARDAAARDLPLEFTLIGYSAEDHELEDSGRVFITGLYDDGEVQALLQRERPHALWLPSVCPETWSYTLTHALRHDLPIVAFDLGAIAERLRAQNRGILLPLDTNPNTLNDTFLTLTAGSESTRANPMFLRPTRGKDSQRLR